MGKAKGPRRKRMNRPSRLQAAKTWIPKYNGKSIVKGYSKWFCVNKLCAVTELEMLGYTFSNDFKSKLKEAEVDKQEKTKHRKEARRKKLEEFAEIDGDETFAFIAGYTEGGIPFGITWEEAEEMNEIDQTDHERSERIGN